VELLGWCGHILENTRANSFTSKLTLKKIVNETELH
jgi:hypothetical protein